MEDGTRGRWAMCSAFAERACEELVIKQYRHSDTGSDTGSDTFSDTSSLSHQTFTLLLPTRLDTREGEFGSAGCGRYAPCTRCLSTLTWSRMVICRAPGEFGAPSKTFERELLRLCASSVGGGAAAAPALAADGIAPAAAASLPLAMNASYSRCLLCLTISSWCSLFSYPVASSGVFAIHCWHGV